MGGSPQLTSNTMAFQRARLCLPRDTAKRLIRAGLALGLERKANRDCYSYSNCRLVNGVLQCRCCGSSSDSE